MELTMLGCGHAMVTKCYNTCFIIENNNEYLLVDAGGGNTILSHLEKVNMNIKDIHSIFVTHLHTDHVLGVIWIIRKVSAMMNANKYEGEFTIYCHQLTREFLESVCQTLLTEKLNSNINTRIHFDCIEDQDHREIIGLDIEFFDIHSTKQLQYGFSIKECSLTCLGDEPYNKYEEKYVKNINYLLTESYCLYSEKDKYKPYEKHHSTALDAGKIAEEMNVKNLVLYHSEDSDLKHKKQKYTDEAKTVYSGNVIVPLDLEKIIIK